MSELMHNHATFARRVGALALAVALAGCASVAKDPPQLDLPPLTAPDTLALDEWWKRFNDPQLDKLVAEALANNLDLATAMARVDAARALVTTSQGPLFPSLTGNVDAGRARISQSTTYAVPGVQTVGNDYRAGVTASYELDLWGKYRNANKAARDDLLASAYARETVRTSVAATTASAYFTLQALDAELKLLLETARYRKDALDLQRDRYDAGVIGEYDFRASEAEYASVIADVATARRMVATAESALATVLGRSPREVFTPTIVRDPTLKLYVTVPPLAGDLPSDLLARRPDIRQVEAQIAAANLRIDVARADYFPSIALTGTYGSESGALSALFSGPAAVWSIGAGLAQPLLNFQTIKGNVELTTAQRDLLLVTYTQTVQSAFRDAHDAIAENTYSRDALAAQTQRANALASALELSTLRYQSGYSPYLEVLDAQRQLLQAQTLQIEAAKNLRQSFVDLAKALGGGWDYRADAAALTSK
ncbi:MAG: efflux transporter outer membrane subunit [Proteobacteria bacterium]|nr:efflux transporter outer membrane subunit [Pseudomonadota bacterium]